MYLVLGWIPPKNNSCFCLIKTKLIEKAFVAFKTKGITYLILPTQRPLLTLFPSHNDQLVGWAISKYNCQRYSRLTHFKSFDNRLRLSLRLNLSHKMGNIASYRS